MLAKEHAELCQNINMCFVTKQGVQQDGAFSFPALHVCVGACVCVCVVPLGGKS